METFFQKKEDLASLNDATNFGEIQFPFGVPVGIFDKTRK